HEQHGAVGGGADQGAGGEVRPRAGPGPAVRSCRQMVQVAAPQPLLLRVGRPPTGQQLGAARGQGRGGDHSDRPSPSPPSDSGEPFSSASSSSASAASNSASSVLVSPETKPSGS